MTELPASLKALTETAAGILAKAIDDVRLEAKRLEEMRQLEHRAFMAESREALAVLTRQVEERLSTVKDGDPGKDADMATLEGLVREQVLGASERALLVLSNQARDVLPKMVSDEVKTAVDALPPAKQGEPGKDADMEALQRAIVAEVQQASDLALQTVSSDAKALLPEIVAAEVKAAVDAIPRPKDGDPGKDADMDALQKQLEEMVAAIPKPKDGEPGKDAYAGEAKGLFDPQADYRAMDVVSFNGSEWRAKRDNPGELPGDGWMLSAKRGKPGEPGKSVKGDPGQPGKDGANVIAFSIDPADMKAILVRDDGEQIEADFYPVAKAIRGDV